MKYTIDAKGRSIGRVATEVAVILMGKNSPDYTKNTVADVTVTVENASQVRMMPKKARTVMHERYSGYPGGFREESIAQIVAKKGYAELFNLAVYGMLPANKLRARIMKNLIVTE